MIIDCILGSFLAGSSGSQLLYFFKSGHGYFLPWLNWFNRQDAFLEGNFCMCFFAAFLLEVVFHIFLKKLAIFSISPPPSRRALSLGSRTFLYDQLTEHLWLFCFTFQCHQKKIIYIYIYSFVHFSQRDIRKQTLWSSGIGGSSITISASAVMPGGQRTALCLFMFVFVPFWNL